MKKVPAPKVVAALEATESPLPPGDPGGARRARRGGEGGPARAQRRCRLGRRARVDGARGRRGRRAEGQAHPGSEGKASRSRGRVDDAGRQARGGPPAADRTADDEHELPVATYGYFADRTR